MVRFKTRYLVFQIFQENQLTSDLTDIIRSKWTESSVRKSISKTSIVLTPLDLLNIIKEHVHLNFGDWGYGLVSASLSVKYYSPVTCIGILRISRQHYRLVWAALTLINTIHSQHVIIRVLQVNGTIKSAETYIIQYDQNLLLHR
ncbi:hypothetical protein PORY_001701 [Pneumocystis oryctolagi]|uniref:Uncharacterized protein n=1 Tax=Pneumocystis oryctolagi TaxID=42067 RepID=A0ACB7CBA5_9ASCO|nr:hypothetical protein PORY_001701 [Pneumocystis oryctolagi]